MTTYRIINTCSGVDLGLYQGTTALIAYMAMMADAGYRTEADARSAGYTLGAIPDDLIIEEV